MLYVFLLEVLEMERGIVSFVLLWNIIYRQEKYPFSKAVLSSSSEDWTTWAKYVNLVNEALWPGNIFIEY